MLYVDVAGQAHHSDFVNGTNKDAIIGCNEQWIMLN